MRAVRFHDGEAAPRLDDVALPHRGEGEVLVRVEASAVAHLDVSVADGALGAGPPRPYVGGVEGAGVDVETGQQVMLASTALRGLWRIAGAVDMAGAPSGGSGQPGHPARTPPNSWSGQRDGTVDP